jgi:ribonuclease HII
VTIDKKDERGLVELGVKDSKQLTPKQRTRLAKEIERIAHSVVVIRVQPCKIDSYRAQKINLDRIEAMKMAQIIDMCGSSCIYLDALTSNPERFAKLVSGYMQTKSAKIVAENFADQKYPVVSAASIIAKVERDKAIEMLKKKLNREFGNGYPHDERTIEFVKELLKKGKLPSYVRQSWVTAQILQEQRWQRKIKDFLIKRIVRK